MKKNLKVLFSLFMFFLGFVNVYAETVDNVAPQINSISIINTNFVPGDNVSFVVNAEDDISGIRGLSIAFIKADEEHEKPNNFFTISFDCEIKNGVYTYTGKIPTYVSSGEYKFYKANVYDNAGNETYYIISGNFEEWIIENFNLPNININSYSGDIDGPILKSLTFDKNKINAKESILVTAEVIDESNIESVFIVFNHETYLLTKVDDNKYTFSIPFNTSGVYKFIEMQLYDEYENISFYRYNNGESNSNWDNVDAYYTIEKGKYDIVVEGVQDKEAPILTNIIINNKMVNAPASFNIYVLAKDNMDDNLEVQVVLSRADGGYCGECETYYVGRENDKYVFKVVLGQYESPGKYHVGHVYLTDDSGNKTVYALSESPYNDFAIMKEYSFLVVEDTVADVTTSTNSNNFMDIIKNASNNSVISIDITKDTIIKKEVFNLIKEKGITINLETNGIQWVIDGKKITNAKDIDAFVKISFVENYKDIGNWKKKNHKALVIEFKDNGKLPGRTLIRIKADYTFRNYIGIKDLNLYFKNGKNFDLISKGMNLTKDNYYEFYINHNSVYFLSDELIEDEYIQDDYSEVLGNITLNEENVINGNVSDEVKIELEEDNTKNDALGDITTNSDDKDILEENNKTDGVNLHKKIYIIVIVVCLVVVSIFIYLKFIKKK